MGEKERKIYIEIKRGKEQNYRTNIYIYRERDNGSEGNKEKER